MFLGNKIFLKLILKHLLSLKNNKIFNKMKKSILLTFALSLILSISNAQEKLPDGNKTITITEVIHTSSYTYLFGKEDTLAVPKMEAKVGEVYYYKGGFDMVDFKSTELNRTFPRVKFLGGVSKTPIMTKLGPQKNPYEKSANPHGNAQGNPHGNQSGQAMPGNHPATGQDNKPSGKVTSEKEEIKIERVEGGITIAELFKKKAKYEGKTVKIKGVVKKFTDQIMNKNWIHLQDGTEFEGKFDLTITSQETVKIGDVIIIEGKIALNKDFGYGYNYDVLMEEAKVVK